MLRAIASSVCAVSLALLFASAAVGCKRDRTSDNARNDRSGESKNGAADIALIGHRVIVRPTPKDGALTAVLAAEAAKAKAQGLAPYVEIRADWCAPCQKLEANINEPRIADAFEGTYVIRLDSDDWAGKFGAAGLATKSIPVFFALGADGKPTGRRIDGGAWGDDTPANMAPPLKQFFHGS